MTGERLSDVRLTKWLKENPEQVWFCDRCMDLHTPDWNCTKSFMFQTGKTEIDKEVKQVMNQRGI